MAHLPTGKEYLLENHKPVAKEFITRVWFEQVCEEGQDAPNHNLTNLDYHVMYCAEDGTTMRYKRCCVFERAWTPEVRAAMQVILDWAEDHARAPRDLEQGTGGGLMTPDLPHSKDLEQRGSTPPVSPDEWAATRNPRQGSGKNKELLTLKGRAALDRQAQERWLISAQKDPATAQIDLENIKENRSPEGLNRYKDHLRKLRRDAEAEYEGVPGSKDFVTNFRKDIDEGD